MVFLSEIIEDRGEERKKKERGNGFLWVPLAGEWRYRRSCEINKKINKNQKGSVGPPL